jgi:Zn-dependent protease/CBS domain-containing protein
VSPTFRFGRIAGVPIGANWTWVLVVVLIAWSLGAGVFPETNPGLSDTAYTLMAAIAVPVFFACLLLHELGHAVRAQREGMEIEGITLWVFGGVAQFRGAFPSAGAEFRIAIAGPVVSLVLGVVFLATALVLPLPSAVDGVVFWLGYINLTLLAFNLLPALPLDGGRVLRAALWQVKGDFLAATRTAAAVGRTFGQLLIFGGVLLALSGAGIGGLWLAFIGWFILVAAEAEAGAALQHAALSGRRVRDAMVADPVTVAADLSLERFLDDVVLGHRHTAYPVIGPDGRPAGIISFRDAMRVPRPAWPERTVAQHMQAAADALVVEPGAPLEEVWPRLSTSPMRRALVVEHGRLVGLLSVTDVVRILDVAAVQSSSRNGGYSSRMSRA